MKSQNQNNGHSSKTPFRITLTLLTLGFLISGLCMLYLVKSGVSLRTAPIISPSPIKENMSEMVDSLFVRLLPEIQPHHFVVWGVLPFSSETQSLLQMLMGRYQLIYKNSVTAVTDASFVDNSFLQSCPSPCWIFLPLLSANELSFNKWISDRPVLAKKSYTTVTIVYFDRPLEKPQTTSECLKEKILDLDCLISISIRDSYKKMKTQHERYFFVRQYNQKDLFLFIEKPKGE